MLLPPEVLFHRYFREQLSPTERERYRGKHDLTGLEPPEFQPLLVAFQDALNESLRDTKLDVAGHVSNLTFHFDYVDSTVPNAIAFRDGDYSFIGVTIPLIYGLWDTSQLLGQSGMINSLLRIDLQGDERNGLRVLLFRTMLFFVVLHEWTHHVHGHVGLRSSDSSFFNEIPDNSRAGGMDTQTLEVDAYAYATYYLLANLILESARSSALQFLKLEAESSKIQDEVLFSCFVIAVGAFFYVRPPVTVDSENIYKLTHPPQAARLNCLMQRAMSWCARFRPGLDEAWMSLNRFQQIMKAVAETTRSITGRADWAAQTAFLRSDYGSEYAAILGSSVEAYIRSLSSGPVTNPNLFITLVPSPDDPRLSPQTYQQELSEVAHSLTSAGIEVSSSVALREALGSEAQYLGEFGVRAATTIGPVVGGVLGAWLHARCGRKVRLKVGDVEAEAQTIEQVEELLRRGEEFQKRTQQPLLRDP